MTASCGLCETELADGYLCPGDTLAASERLARMPKLWQALAAFMAPGGRGPSEHVSVSRSEPPMPVSEPAFDMRVAGIVKTLESWRSFMQADRGWGEPVIEGGVERRVIAAARALSLNLEWMAANWPPAGDMARELRDLESSVVSIIDPRDSAERGTRLGKCPAIDPGGVICGAVLRYYPGDEAVTCKWCLCAYLPATWRELKAWMDEDEAAYNALSGAAS